MSRGLFIVMEGVEGAGKTTQCRLLASWMEETGVSFTLAREPGGTPVGEAIRRVVLDRGDLTMPPETELFLILGARAAFVLDVVLPALEAGRVVLADRFELSTFAYQSFGRGLDLEEVRRANRLATGGLRPDLCIVLDVPPEVGLERKGAAGPGDRIEREGSAFFRRVREGYRTLASQEPNVRLVEAGVGSQDVQASLRRALWDLFPETFPAAEV